MPLPASLLRSAVIAVSLTTAGCATVGEVAGVIASAAAETFSPPPGGARLDWKGVLIAADADANLDSPVAVDLVFVRDPVTLERVQALSAARWFATRADLLRTFPGALAVHGVELVPRQSLRLTQHDLGSPRVAAVLVFADYATPGEHRVRLAAGGRQGHLVTLGARGFTVTPLPD